MTHFTFCFIESCDIFWQTQSPSASELIRKEVRGKFAPHGVPLSLPQPPSPSALHQGPKEHYLSLAGSIARRPPTSQQDFFPANIPEYALPARNAKSPPHHLSGIPGSTFLCFFFLWIASVRFNRCCCYCCCFLSFASLL
jgi:hypothetical protein